MMKRTLIDKYLPTLRFKIKRTLIDYLLTFIKPSLESTETVPCLTGRKSVVTVQVIIFPEPWAECGVRLPPLVWTAVLTRFNLTSESLELRWWMMGTSLCSSVPRKWNGTVKPCMLVFEFGSLEFYVSSMNVSQHLLSIKIFLPVIQIESVYCRWYHLSMP